MRKRYFMAILFVMFLVFLMVACGRQMPGTLTPMVLPTPVVTKAEQNVTPVPSLELLWSSPVVASHERIETALIDDRTLYYSTSRFIRFTTGRQYIGAFDLQSRQSRWVVSATVDLPVMVEQGHVLLVDETTATLTALKSSDGSWAWQVPLPASWGYYGATTGLGLAFVGSGYEIVAVDAATGHLGWRYSLPPGFVVDPLNIEFAEFRSRYSPLIYDSGVLYVRAVSKEIEGRNTLDCLLLALNVRDGRKLWAFPFVIQMPVGDAPFVATQPAVGDAGLLILTWGGSAYFLDVATGQMIWEKTDLVLPMKMGPHIWSERALIEQVNELTGLNTQSGQVEWSQGIFSIDDLWMGEGMAFLVHGIESALLTAIDLQTGDTVAEVSLTSLMPRDERVVVALAGDSHTLYLVLARNVYAFSMPSAPSLSTAPAR